MTVFLSIFTKDPLHFVSCILFLDAVSIIHDKMPQSPHEIVKSVKYLPLTNWPSVVSVFL